MVLKMSSIETTAKPRKYFAYSVAAGAMAGLAIAFALSTSVVETEPGFESVILMDPPFLPAVVTGLVDTTGTKRHYNFAKGLPVRINQEWTEFGVEVFTSNHEIIKVDVRVKLKVRDSAKLIMIDGEDWYQKEVSSAVRAAAGLAAMKFSLAAIKDRQENAQWFGVVMGVNLQTFISDKDLPLSVIDAEIVGMSESPES